MLDFITITGPLPLRCRKGIQHPYAVPLRHPVRNRVVLQSQCHLHRITLPSHIRTGFYGILRGDANQLDDNDIFKITP